MSLNQLTYNNCVHDKMITIHSDWNQNKLSLRIVLYQHGIMNAKVNAKQVNVIIDVIWIVRHFCSHDSGLFMTPFESRLLFAMQKQMTELSYSFETQCTVQIKFIRKKHTPFRSHQLIHCCELNVRLRDTIYPSYRILGTLNRIRLPKRKFPRRVSY